MKIRQIITFLSIGIIIGFIIGGVDSLYTILTNHYLQYGLIRLSAIVFQDYLNAYVLYFFLGLAGFNLIIYLLFKLLKLSINKIIVCNIFSATILVLLFFADKIAVKISQFTLLLAFNKFIYKLGELLKEKESLTYFLNLYGRFKTPLFISLASLVIVAIIFWLLTKFNWEEFAKKFNQALIKKTAFFIVIIMGALNLGIVVEGKINPLTTPNIILIVADTLRSDHLGYNGYGRNTSPNIDKLAGEGVVYSNVYSNSPWTKPSVASIFTSLYPNVHKAISTGNILPDKVLTMAEIFKSEGYYTAFFNAGNYVISRMFNFNQGFDFYYHPIKVDYVTASVVTNEFISQVPKLKKKNYFAYIHYMDIHLPYNKNEYNFHFAEENKELGLTPGDIDRFAVKTYSYNNTLSGAQKNYLESLYDGQIAFVDHNIGRIINALKSQNMLDNTIIIFSSDHGEEFWDHDQFAHGHSLYNELLHVPLIIWDNKKTKHAEVKSIVRLVDLLPLILEKANISAKHLKEERRGVLSNLADNKQIAPIFSMGTYFGDEKYSLTKGDYKIIYNTGDEKNKFAWVVKRDKEYCELYNLINDPLEKNNLVETEGRLARQLEKELAIYKNADSPFESSDVEINEKGKERLKSLGYLQ